MAIQRNKIEKFLQNTVIVRVYGQIDSTNNEAKRCAAAGITNSVLYVTDCQTAGRGRHGHDFYSPKGSGLYFTLALPLRGEAAETQLITCAAAVAVCEGIEALTPHHPRIKWVNDVFVGDRKVAGILTELVLDKHNQPVSVIIGIGINLTTDRFPDEFASKAGSIGDADPNRLCAVITDRLIARYCADNNSFLEKYRRLSFCLGKEIRYIDRDGCHTATAAAIADDGSLVVEENGKKRSLRSGEISIVIPPSP